MRVFGNIRGTKPGDMFSDRKSLAKAGVHPPLVAGISGSQSEGADSIVLSGGYEDDEDFGDVIIYTGAGGQDKSKKQITDQKLESVNLALAKSKIEGLPVRVTRGYKHSNENSPNSGYQYAGLYRVEDYWKEIGKSGFIIWRYRLVSHPENMIIPEENMEINEYNETNRVVYHSSRVVRDYVKAQNVKKWHKYKCQVCGITIQTRAGLYAEACHIKPLGTPHNGPDTENNILCLCPNHHVMFDNGTFSITNDLTLIGIEGQLTTVKSHIIDKRFIKYHRTHFHDQNGTQS